MQGRRWVTAGDVMVLLGLAALVAGLWLLDWRLGLAALGAWLMLTGMERVRRGG